MNRVLAALVLVASVLAGCTGGAPAPTAVPPPAAPTSAPVAKPAASPSAAPAASPVAVASPSSAPVSAAAPAATGPLTTVKYGQLTPPSVSDSGVVIAEAKGWFAEQGIKLDMVAFDTAANMISPLGTNQIDAGGGALGAGLYNAVARNVPLVITADKATTSAGNGYLGVVVRKALVDSGAVKTTADLKGKKIAMSATGIAPEVALNDLLKEAGLTMKDVEFVPLAFPDMVVAMANGSIDAAQLIEPFLTDVLTKGVGTLYRRADQYSPDLQNAVILYSPNLSANADLGTRFMVAYLKGVRLYNDAFRKNDVAARAEVINILSQSTSVKDKALYEKVAMPGLDPNGTVNRASLQKQQEYYLAAGQQATAIDIAKVVNPSFAEAAVRRLGDYK